MHRRWLLAHHPEQPEHVANAKLLCESAVISGHQRSSVVISGHQWSSVVISGHLEERGHQRSSAVISGHQRSSVVIRGHQGSFASQQLRRLLRERPSEALREAIRGT